MTEDRIEKDLVCGMEVTVTSSTPKTTYKGKEYYFCCTGCLAQFEKNPENFVHATENHSHGDEHHHDEGECCGGKGHHDKKETCCKGDKSKH